MQRSSRAIGSLPEGGNICLLDIGAAGGIEPRWEAFQHHVDYIGFEPDERSRRDLEGLIEKKTRSHFIFPHAIWNREGEIDFHLCKKPKVSSVFVANRDLVDKFHDSERFDVTQKLTVETTTIDATVHQDVDFIKMDIQGGELAALQGAESVLDGTLGLELEVEFLPMYKGQPLFGEVSQWLASRGFEFVDFTSICRWERTEHNTFGQCIFGDALFLRTPETLDFGSMTQRKIGAYLGILAIYRRFDLLDVTFDLMTPDLKDKFTRFRNFTSKLAASDRRARSFNRMASKLITAFGTGYETHLIY